MSTFSLQVSEFRLRSIMPGEDIDRLESQYPGFLDAQIGIAQSWIEARLRKRYLYLLPFTAPYPEAYLGWIVSIVTLQAYYRRGFNPSGAENEDVIKAAATARDEVKEAADSKDGLFDLPVRQDLPSTSGIAAGAPFWYSEASPYTWADLQREDGSSEDNNGH